MITKQLLKSVKVSQAITPTAGAAGATDIEGATLDMAGFGGVLAIVTFGAITTGAVTGLVIQESDNSDMSSPTVATLPAITVADDDDGKVCVLDHFKPTKRYCRLHVDRATQNAVVASAEYIQYNAVSEPVTSASSTVKVSSGISAA